MLIFTQRTSGWSHKATLARGKKIEKTPRLGTRHSRREDGRG
jgi:hypothetical protein